jgi:hypothetical protein
MGGPPASRPRCTQLGTADSPPRSLPVGGSRGLQAHECKIAIKVALAAGYSFMLLRCGSHHKKLERIWLPQ